MIGDLFDKRGEQTIIKHRLLESYLRAWAKIIGRWFKKAYYIDAFAGTGAYGTGEEGSPVIAARILMEEQKRSSAQFGILCIEKDRRNRAILEESLSEFEGSLEVKIFPGEFGTEVDKVLSKVENLPAFFFIDPAGFSGMPLSKIRDILVLPHKEVLINFMYNAIQRWQKAPSVEQTMTDLYGAEAWSAQRTEKERLRLYMDQIRSKTNAFVWSFQNKFPDKERTFYYLVYACKNLTAFKIMKDIMFKEETRKHFQPSLFDELDFNTFVDSVYQRIERREGRYSTLLAYTLQETQYLDRNLKKTLRQLSAEEKIVRVANGGDPVYGLKGQDPDACLSSVASEARVVEPLRVVYSRYQMLDRSERELVQQVGDGSIIKRFDKTPVPVRERDVVCPHFIELKWATGCPFDCSWCYLKGTFRFSSNQTKPRVKDFEKIERHLGTFFKFVSKPELLNTGELSDSLMTEGGAHPFSKFVVPLFESQDRHKVLFVTKSNRVEHLLEMEAQNRVIVSFSLNPSSIAQRWEKGAPAVESRIEAGKKLYDKGYKVRIRIDPMVPVDGWKEKYLELLDQIFDAFVPERLTIGSLRGLQSTINGSSDKSWVRYLSETSNWGRKIQFSVRSAMYRLVLSHPRERYEYRRVALCKETKAMWQSLDMDYGKIQCNCVW